MNAGAHRSIAHRVRSYTTLVLVALLLAACAPAPVRRGPDAALLAAQSAREAAIARQPAWSLAGRIAVSDGRDGGSGRIEWRQRGADFDIRLSAPVSRQSWRLRRSAGVARLEGLEGGPREGADPQALLYEATGWLIPVDALAAWARGARADGPAELTFAADGRPATLDQAGWRVDYRAWDPQGRPQKVFAERGQARVRLLVERWDQQAADSRRQTEE